MCSLEFTAQGLVRPVTVAERLELPLAFPRERQCACVALGNLFRLLFQKRPFICFSGFEHVGTGGGRERRVVGGPLR